VFSKNLCSPGAKIAAKMAGVLEDHVLSKVEDASNLAV
jgi:hypothetical protein